MPKKFLGFVDGENLVARYQAMLSNSYIPRDVDYVEDAFVWSRHITASGRMQMDQSRVQYYTSLIGSHDDVDAVSNTIAATRYYSPGEHVMSDGAHQLIPRVFKRSSNTQKVSIADVQITIDVMRAALTMPIDGIFLITGDGDFLSLVHEVTRTTNKQMFVGALSSGLASGLRTSVDRFIDLDEFFFEG